MKLVILESPYAAGRGFTLEDNLAFARLCIRLCLAKGESPIASHLLFTQPGVLDDDIPGERELGIAAGLAWLRAADYSVFYTDHGWSSGMLNALHKVCMAGTDFRIRGPIQDPRMPATLDEDLAKYIRSKFDPIEPDAHPPTTQDKASESPAQ